MSTPSGPQTSLLVYDPVHQGHHGEYLSHLLRYVCDRTSALRATFVVHPEYLQRRSELVERARATGRVRFEEEQIRRSSEEDSPARIAARSFREWRDVVARARRREVDHCLLMELNPLQLALAVPRPGRLPFRVHGILFHPYTRFRPEGSGIQRLRTAATRWRKRWILGRVARNPDVRSIFVLNDPSSVDRLNRELADEAPFVFLPDPVPPVPSGEARDFDSPGEGSGRARDVVVTPGAIRRNKGVLEALEAFLRVDPELVRKVSYRVPGRIEDGLRDDLDRTVERVRSRRSELEVELEDRFLCEEEFRAVIARADVVLVPYRRAEGSSGILGHAAREGVPVVGPNAGLIGSLIEEYGLGLTADTGDPAALGRALERAVRDADRLKDSPGMRRYVRERTPEAFAETLVTRILGGSSAPRGAKA